MPNMHRLTPATGAPGAQNAPHPVATQIEALVRATHEAGRFDGTVLVSDGGRVLYRGGIGLANVEWGVPNAPDTRFRVGSVTKQFTAALVLQFAEEDRVDLQAPVSAYVPGVPVDRRITTHHLLTHTSGLPNYTALPDFDELQRRPHTPAELMALVEGMPLDFEPGTAWAYTNSGYVLLGMLIEAVSGEPYAATLRTRLLDPLGLEASTCDDGTTAYPRAASGYVRGVGALHRAAHIDPSVSYAAGMLLSSVDDLRAWSDALYGGRVFRSPETLALMHAAHAEVPGTDGQAAYGYGVVVGTVPVGGCAVPVAQHDGGINGFMTGLWRLTDRDGVIAMCSNTQDGSEDLAMGILALLHRESVEIPPAPASSPPTSASA